MSIELDDKTKCPFGLHDFHPIIEGGQTVGVICMHCGHKVREDMEHSIISVDERGINFPPTFFEQMRVITTRDFPKAYHRKDPRF